MTGQRLLARRDLLKLSAAGLLAGCGGSTGGALVTPSFAVGGLERDPGAGPLGFASGRGWQITLEAAAMTLGPIYFNIGAPNGEAFRGPLVIVQVTHQVVVDLLDPVLHPVPGGADGQSGRAVVAEIGLLPPDASSSDADRARFGQAFGLIAGRASKAGVEIPFAGVLAIDRSLATPQTPLAALQRVRSAAVDLEFTAAPQQLTMRVDPRLWFESVEFDQLLAGAPDADGRYGWPLRGSFMTLLLQGVKAEEAVYRFALAPAPL